MPDSGGVLQTEYHSSKEVPRTGFRRMISGMRRIFERGGRNVKIDIGKIGKPNRGDRSGNVQEGRGGDLGRGMRQRHVLTLIVGTGRCRFLAAPVRAILCAGRGQLLTAQQRRQFDLSSTVPMETDHELRRPHGHDRVGRQERRAQVPQSAHRIRIITTRAREMFLLSREPEQSRIPSPKYYLLHWFPWWTTSGRTGKTTIIETITAITKSVAYDLRTV